MDDPTRALARCVGDVGAFLDRHWGRRPLVAAGVDPGGFADLLSLDDVDRIVGGTALRLPAFRLVKDGQTVPAPRYTRSARVGSRRVDDLADVGAVYRQFHEGATIVLQGLHRSWPALARFCRDLEIALGHRVQANAYVTPPGSSGLRVHADAHDVFALQTHGRKQWVVYPADEAAGPETDGASDAEGDLDLDLGVGDCLYLPKGTRHAARTVGSPSVHITIGVRLSTWLDVLRRVVDMAAAEPAFAERLPAGHVAGGDGFTAAVAERLRAFGDWLDKVDPADVAHDTRERFVTARPPLLTGQLRDLVEVEAIDEATPLRRRPGSLCDLDVHDDRLVVTLGDRRLVMPLHVAPAMRVVLGRERLRPADLAGHLDAAGSLVLARRLVREGLLTVDRG